MKLNYRRNIEAIAYDLEGTVIDVEFAHHEAHILAAKDFGKTLTLEDCFNKLPHFIGGPDDKIAEEIVGLRFGTSDNVAEHVQFVLESKKRRYNMLIRDRLITPRKGFIDFFNATKGMGLKYTIGSLTSTEQACLLLEKGGLIKLFGYENIVLREDVKNVKPAPDVWYETAKRAGVSPDTQIIFEDSPRGIIGGMEVGAYCIGMPVYNRPDTIQALSNAGAKRIFMNWNEINPETLINNIRHGR